MVIGSVTHQIEAFGRRVDWCLSHLVPDEEVVRAQKGILPSCAIKSRSELWGHVSRLAGLTAANANRAWERRLNATNTNPIPDPYVRALASIYPDLPAEVMCIPTWQEFWERVSKITEACARWDRATKYVSQHRQDLAALGKVYHRTVDDTPDFPLIAKRHWLLDTPQELVEDFPAPKFVRHVKDDPAPRLPGLNVDYLTAVTRALGRGRPRWNGECYRLLELKDAPQGLDFTFGTTTYFNYVNSLESLAAELADFRCKNGPFAIPDILPLRGAPGEIFNFYGRSAFAGVNCLLMLKNHFDGVYSSVSRRTRNKFVLHDRPSDAVEARNTIHVVPAGGHQPLTKEFGDDREVSIWCTAAREFCEELFSKAEAQELKSHGEDFFHLPEIAEILDPIFRNGAGRIFLLGAGLDPLTTKPEILCAIVIDWHKAAISMNRNLKIVENYEGKALFCDLTKDNLAAAAAADRTGKKPLLPAGRACLELAAKHYDFLMDSV